VNGESLSLKNDQSTTVSQWVRIQHGIHMLMGFPYELVTSK
jgi:hypothetical protein